MLFQSQYTIFTTKQKFATIKNNTIRIFKCFWRSLAKAEQSKNSIIVKYYYTVKSDKLRKPVALKLLSK